MNQVKNNPNLIILSRERLEEMKHKSYKEGYSDGIRSVSSHTKADTTVKKAAAKAKTEAADPGGSKQDLRMTVLEKNTDE